MRPIGVGDRSDRPSKHQRSFPVSRWGWQVWLLADPRRDRATQGHSAHPARNAGSVFARSFAQDGVVTNKAASIHRETEAFLPQHGKPAFSGRPFGAVTAERLLADRRLFRRCKAVQGHPGSEQRTRHADQEHIYTEQHQHPFNGHRLWRRGAQRHQDPCQ